MDSTTLCMLSAVSVLALVYWIKFRLNVLSVLRKNGITGPKPHFIYGNIYDHIEIGNVKRTSLWLKEFGPIFGYYIGSTATVCVADPDLLKLIQIKDYHLFTSRRMIIPGGFDAMQRAKDMLIGQKGKRWKEVRSILTPTFNASKMKQSVPLIHDAIDALLENVEKKGDQETDMYELYQGLTMDIIGRSAFGVKTDAQRNPKDPFLMAAKAAFNVKITGFVNILLGLNMWFPEFTAVIWPLRYLQAIILEALNLSHNALLYGVCRQIMDARRKNITENQTPWARHDLLQHMMEAKMSREELLATKGENLTISSDMKQEAEVVAQSDGQPKEKEKAQKYAKKLQYMTDAEIVANSVLFFEAGYETTSTALGFVTHMLVNNMDVQEKVRQELLDLFEREGRFDYNTVTELQYMEAVLYETMRIYPPITFFVTRVAETDYQYKDITIPKGVGVVVPVYQLHHDPKLWEEPEKFDPNRFLGAEAKGKINPLGWQVFGAGPRNCIGMRFALLEAKLALAKILHKYRLEPSPSTEFGEISCEYKGISMCPKNGVYVRAVPV